MVTYYTWPKCLQAGNHRSRHHYSSNLPLLPGPVPSSCPAAFWSQEFSRSAQVPFRGCFTFFLNECKTFSKLTRWKGSAVMLRYSRHPIKGTLFNHSENILQSLIGTRAKTGDLLCSWVQRRTQKLVITGVAMFSSAIFSNYLGTMYRITIPEIFFY